MIIDDIRSVIQTDHENRLTERYRHGAEQNYVIKIFVIILINFVLLIYVF